MVSQSISALNFSVKAPAGVIAVYSEISHAMTKRTVGTYLLILTFAISSLALGKLEVV